MKLYFKLDRKLSAQEKRPVSTPAKPWSSVRCKRAEYSHNCWHGFWYYGLLMKYNGKNKFPLLKESLVGRNLREYIINQDKRPTR